MTGIITSASVAGQRDSNKELAKAVRAHIAANPAEFGSSDVTSPEADDELGAGADLNKGLTGNTTTNTSTLPAGTQLGPGHAFLGSVTSAFQESNSAVAVLALSNVVLLVLLLSIWLFGSSRVKVTQKVLSMPQEAGALQRLATLETAWGQFRQCVDALAVHAD